MRASFLLLCLMACDLAEISPRPEAEPARSTKPSVLVVTLDTTRADRIGAYGGPANATPTLNRLAAEGSVFTRAYTVTPLTIPTHSSLHTGLLPPRHGVRDNGDHFLGEEVTTLAEILRASGYATMASVGAEVTSRHWGFAQGFDEYFDDMGVARRDRNRWAIERPAASVVDDALKWFEKRGPQQPWFAWVHFFDAHHPYEPPPVFANRFPSRPYLAEIASVDDQLGRLIDQLRLQGKMEHTWVIVLADHGEGMGEHGESLHGMLLYDGTTRIPLIIRPPEGRAVLDRVGFPVSTVDVMPTVLDAVGVPVPDDLDGISLRDWVQASGAPVPPLRTDRAVYVESLYAWHHYGWAPQRAVVDPIFKFIDGSRPELYARTDREELENLAAIREPVAAGLQTYLDQNYAELKLVEGAGATKALTAEQVSQLEALGYMASTSVETDSDAPPFRGELRAPMANLGQLRDLEAVRVARQTGELEEAEAAAWRLLGLSPGFVQLRMQLVSVLEEQGKLDEALREVDRVIEERPSSSAWATSGRLRLRTGDRTGGLMALETAVETDPYVVGHWLSLLMGHWGAGDLTAFQKGVADAATRLPNEPVISGLSGVVLGMTGRREEARHMLETSLASDPEIPIAREALGRIALAEGDAVRGEALLREEMAYFPPALSARRELIRTLAAQKRFEEQAHELVQLGTFERPPRSDTAWSLGQALYNIGKLEPAERAVDQCLQLQPDSAGCWLLRANVLNKLGRNDEAVKAFEQAKALRDGG